MDVKVRVVRFRKEKSKTCETPDGYPYLESLYGYFYSDVYAVNGNKMLVYDDGMLDYDDDGFPHFEWVNFNESYYDSSTRSRRSVVELVTNDN